MSPHPRTAGEEDVVEFLLQKNGRLLHFALDVGDKFLGKGLGNQPLNDGAAGRGHLRGFQHGGIAGGNGGNQR